MAATTCPQYPAGARLPCKQDAEKISATMVKSQGEDTDLTLQVGGASNADSAALPK